jgi:hypothetical protein
MQAFWLPNVVWVRAVLLRPCPAALFACIYSTARPAVMRAFSPINTRDFPFADAPIKQADAPKYLVKPPIKAELRITQHR